VDISELQKDGGLLNTDEDAEMSLTNGIIHLEEVHLLPWCRSSFVFLPTLIKLIKHVTHNTIY
jgi:hypothetical protein